MSEHEGDSTLDSVSALTGDPLFDEARERFQRCAEWEYAARQHFVEDLKFAFGDADNGFQWPNAVRRARDNDSRPCLTLNVVRQHNLQIINEGKQNKSSPRVRGVASGATAESALAMEAIVRHVEYISNAQEAYSVAREFQVYGGIGWWRLVTDWAGGDSWHQEIFIRPVVDPLAVYVDPDAKQRDCSDAKFAFVFDNVLRSELEEAYPEIAGLAGETPFGIGSGDDDWVTKDHIRICEYFRKVPKRDKLLSWRDAKGARRSARASRLPAPVVSELLDDPQTRWREVWDDVIEWKLFVGNKVVDETVWPGKYIPLIRVIGEEQIVEGQLDRKGHTRAMKDPQRMFNYNASAQVEFVALQSKTPYVAAAKAIEEYEGYWNSANNANHSVLPFNHMDDEGNPIPPPQRQQPPAASAAYDSGMQTAFNQLMMVSGQWQNQMGMMGNERTGEAIQQRQAQGDTATYHFRDNFNAALVYTGKQIIDLVPKIYDTHRVLKCLADDGTDFELEINPSMREAYFQELAHDGAVAKRVLNPQLGEYSVMAQPGEAYGTRREETVRAFTLLLTQAPNLVPVVGDLLLQAMDFKDAQEAAQRLRRLVPPQALGQGPSQQEQVLMQQNSALQAELAKTLNQLAKEKLKLVGKDQMRDIDVYKAETDRLKVLTPEAQPQDLEALVHQLVQGALDNSLENIISANAHSIAESDPTALGAQMAPDGKHYLSDPTRPGQFIRLDPAGQGNGQ